MNVTLREVLFSYFPGLKGPENSPQRRDSPDVVELESHKNCIKEVRRSLKKMSVKDKDEKQNLTNETNGNEPINREEITITTNANPIL